MPSPRCRVEITRYPLFAKVVVTRDGFPPLLTTMHPKVSASSREIAKLKAQLAHRALEAEEDPASELEPCPERTDGGPHYPIRTQFAYGHNSCCSWCRKSLTRDEVDAIIALGEPDDPAHDIEPSQEEHDAANECAQEGAA